jgi:hypothetical protein
MIIANDIRLPHVDEPPPNLAVMIVGKALAEAYRAAMDGPLPERLTRILREIEEREIMDGQRA